MPVRVARKWRAEYWILDLSSGVRHPQNAQGAYHTRPGTHSTSHLQAITSRPSRSASLRSPAGPNVNPTHSTSSSSHTNLSPRFVSLNRRKSPLYHFAHKHNDGRMLDATRLPDARSLYWLA